MLGGGLVILECDQDVLPVISDRRSYADDRDNSLVGLKLDHSYAQLEAAGKFGLGDKLCGESFVSAYGGGRHIQAYHTHSEIWANSAEVHNQRKSCVYFGCVSPNSIKALFTFLESRS